MSENNQIIGTLPSNLDLSWAGAGSEIEKGHLDEAFSYSSLKEITIKKTGKEIKEAMDKNIVHENSEILLAKTKAEAHKVEGVEPVGNVSGYRLRNYPKSSFGELPKIYSYNQKYPEDSYIDAPKSPVVSGTMSGFDQPVQRQRGVALDSKIKRSMQLYNDCIDKIMESMVEIKIAETVKNGMDDKKSYELTVKQAGALGF